MAKQSRKDKKADAPSYEVILQNLEETVARLETGGISLEEAMEAYESGVALAAQCQALLDTAEQRIEKLRMLEESG